MNIYEYELQDETVTEAAIAKFRLRWLTVTGGFWH